MVKKTDTRFNAHRALTIEIDIDGNLRFTGATFDACRACHG